MSLESYLIVGGIAVAGVFAAPIILGFGTAGVAAGSTAAAIQSGIGCVQAGSAFSTMTSLGMQGILAKGAATGVGTAAIGLFSYFY